MQFGCVDKRQFCRSDVGSVAGRGGVCHSGRSASSSKVTEVDEQDNNRPCSLY